MLLDYAYLRRKLPKIWLGRGLASVIFVSMFIPFHLANLNFTDFHAKMGQFNVQPRSLLGLAVYTYVYYFDLSACMRLFAPVDKTEFDYKTEIVFSDGTVQTVYGLVPSEPEELYRSRSIGEYFNRIMFKFFRKKIEYNTGYFLDMGNLTLCSNHLEYIKRKFTPVQANESKRIKQISIHQLVRPIIAPEDGDPDDWTYGPEVSTLRCNQNW